jgi:hypothetical protein
MHDIWGFYQDRHDAWHWQCVNPLKGRYQQSVSGFRTRCLCVADAKLAGYEKRDPALRRSPAPETAGGAA